MERVYEPTGMTTEKWKAIKPSRIKLSDLKMSQEQVSIDGLLNAASNGPTFSGDNYPHIVIHQNIKWVSDGHHRIVVAMIRNRKTILARILPL